jgi:hypothetical protein
MIFAGSASQDRAPGKISKPIQELTTCTKQRVGHWSTSDYRRTLGRAEREPRPHKRKDATRGDVVYCHMCQMRRPTPGDNFVGVRCRLRINCLNEIAISVLEPQLGPLRLLGFQGARA